VSAIIIVGFFRTARLPTGDLRGAVGTTTMRERADNPIQEIIGNLNAKNVIGARSRL
jgi:hypothetical protein